MQDMFGEARSEALAALDALRSWGPSNIPKSPGGFSSGSMLDDLVILDEPNGGGEFFMAMPPVVH